MPRKLVQAFETFLLEPEIKILEKDALSHKSKHLIKLITLALFVVMLSTIILFTYTTVFYAKKYISTCPAHFNFELFPILGLG